MESMKRPVWCGSVTSMSSDYDQFLLENSLNEQAMVGGLIYVDNFNLVDRRPMDGIIVRSSKRHGLGAFVTRPFKKNDAVGSILRNGIWTLVGRYTNHCGHPNTVAEKNPDNSFDLVALEPISCDDEITADYRQVMKAMR